MSAPEGCADPTRYERAEELAGYHRPEQVWPAHLECTCGNALPCSIAQSAARSMVAAVTMPPASGQRALSVPGLGAPLARGVAEVPWAPPCDSHCAAPNRPKGGTPMKDRSADVSLTFGRRDETTTQRCAPVRERLGRFYGGGSPAGVWTGMAGISRCPGRTSGVARPVMTGVRQVAQQSQSDTLGDFATAQAVVAMHQPFTDPWGMERCASASRAWSRLGPPWPCLLWRLAQRVLAAHERVKANQDGVGPRVTS